jgi:prepilin-type N-terminal cleavage/methylation domain-containing protein
MAKIKKKAAQVTPKILRPTINSKGFSLLEVIVTVSIIAAVVTLAIPRLNNKNTELRATVRKLAVLSRELKNRAKLQNATYRLVINMAVEGKEPVHQYWVERAQGQILNDYDPENPPTLPDPADAEKNKEEPPPAFTLDVKVLKEPQKLPSGLLFESVELASAEEPITSGLVYIHYLPSGYADEAAIHLKQGEKIRWTLAVQPLTGRVDIIDSFRSLEDLNSK